jgi:hypothetical protein
MVEDDSYAGFVELRKPALLRAAHEFVLRGDTSMHTSCLMPPRG